MTAADDRARVTRRLAAAQQSAGLDALVEVAMSETETLRAENERLRGWLSHANAVIRGGALAEIRAEAAEAENGRLRRNTAGLYGRAHAAEARLDAVRVLREDWRRMTTVMALPSDRELVEAVVVMLDAALDSDATASGQPTSEAAWDEGFEAGHAHASAYTHGDNGPPDPPLNPYARQQGVDRTDEGDKR